MNLRVGSLASGIGGDAVAWHPLGWESAFFSEIDKFPSAVLAVLAARFPGVPRYKGLGNAWATRVFRWVGRRIEMVIEARSAEEAG